MTEYKEISVEEIVLRGDNPRQTFDETRLRELGMSMLEDGQLQEVWVRPKGDKFELVTGERRFRAARLVGIRNIRARVEDVDDARLMEIRLLENTQREDLTEAEKGNAIAHLLAEFPEKYPTIGNLAKKLKKSVPTINRWLQKSERLSDFVKKSIKYNRLSDYVAIALLPLEQKEQDKIVRALINFEVPVGEQAEVQREFIKRYRMNPEKYPTVESLEALANEVKGVKKVKIDLSKLSPEAKAEVEKTLEEAKEEAKKLRVKKPRRKIRRQGRPPKEKKEAPPKLEPEERKPLPPLTMPKEVKSITVAFNFPIPLWEKITRYQAQKRMILQDAIISLLESHPLLWEIE